MRLIDADKLNLWTTLRAHCSADVCCDVMDIIDNAPTVDPYEWISVEDRLPDKHTRVLCYFKYEPDSPNVVFENTYYSGGHWMSDGSRITHWMPLPTPPEEKEA